MATAFRDFLVDSLPDQDEELAWTRHRSSSAPQIHSSVLDKLLLQTEDRPFLPYGYHATGKENWATVLIPRYQDRPANRDNPHAEAIDARVNKLRELAQRSNDCFEEESAAALLQFCNELAADRKPGIFLLPNGNLRAVWQNENNEQIGVQFLCDGILQYVILHRGKRVMLKNLGTEEDGSAFEQRIHCANMQRLWFHFNG